VTPSVPIRFEVIERTEAELERFEADPPLLDEPSWLPYGF
jgi:hypothetical protein